MPQRTPSAAASGTPPRRRRPQTRLANVGGGVDLRLPEGARLRRLTLANVSAVCEQLGEHVSTRNVQRMLGGSLRDIGPLVQAWRENRAAGDVTTVTGNDQAQAVGAILMGALQEHSQFIATALHNQAVANAANQRALFEQVERLLRDHLPAPTKATPTREGQSPRRGDVDGLKDLRANLQAVRTDVARMLAHRAEAAPAATGKDLAELGSRIDRLTQAFDQLQAEQRVPPPDSADATIASALSAALGGYEARLAPVVERLDRLASILTTAADTPPAAPPELATTLGLDAANPSSTQ